MTFPKKNIVSQNNLSCTEISDFPYRTLLSEKDSIVNCVEIVDTQGLPFLLMPLESAKKRKLPRRVFLLVLKDNKKRVLIVKRKGKHSHKYIQWTLSGMGDVLAGESAEGAVLRVLERDFHLEKTSPVPLEELHSIPFLEDDTMLSANIFLGGPCKADDILLNPEHIIDILFLTKSELEGLSTKHAEIFHPLLFWALRSGWIF